MRPNRDRHANNRMATLHEDLRKRMLPFTLSIRLCSAAFRRIESGDMNMRMIQTVVMSIGVLLAGSVQGASQTKWDVTKTIHIGGDGGWDYLTVDPQTHRLFVTRSTHTFVIDAGAGKVLGDIPGQ